MATATKLNDAGTWRAPFKVSVNDGGTWRTIQSIKVNDGGTWRTVFQYLRLNETMTEGSGPDGSGGTFYGYVNGSFGSMSSGTLADGTTLKTLVDDDDGVNVSGLMEISGFGADPGISYFSTVVVGGVSLASSSASYSYLAGVARWDWYLAGSFGLDGSGISTVVINP